ncbi:MAG: T9SS type A sorting domain-containing protein, partial [Sphingobacteriales bacterium]
YHPEAPLPWTTKIFWPNDSLVATYQSSGSNWMHAYPTYPGNGKIKVVTEDGCGKRDTSLIDQGNIIQPVRRKEIVGGCPGISGVSGGGDIVLHGNAAAYAGNGLDLPRGTVRIVKKDSQSVSIPQSYTQYNGASAEQDYFFTNLSTGTYVLESIVGCNGFKVYDTIQIKPYVYPIQEQTHITQCGTNAFAFRDTVTGGVSPFTYEIMRSVPSLTALLGGPQSSNTFLIPPGSTLDTIQIRVVDFCGNAHLKEFPVDRIASCLPLGVNSQPNIDRLQNKNINVYPNPSTQLFNIRFWQNGKTDYRIQVINAIGVLVLEKKLYNVDTKTIEIKEQLIPGTYVIKITDTKSNNAYIFKQIVF